jgi:23S rRNA pseudouridine1911/1915/1917 synthase
MKRQVDAPTELLTFLGEAFPDSSKTTLRQMLQQGRVRVNGEPERNARAALERGDTVEVGERQSTQFLPPELAIVYEDEAIIVVAKASGLLTVSTPNEKHRTVQAYLNEYLRHKGYGSRIHVVHRLDRDTSGVLVFARSFEVREKLKEKFAAHEIERVYIAIVEGTLQQDEGSFRSYLREDTDTYHVRSVTNADRGRLAITHYRVIERGRGLTIVEVRLETGRKNQIRVHFSEAGHPVVGDERYGAATNPIGRLGLHAQLLGFEHPVSGKKMTFEMPVPAAFRRLLR